MTHRGDPSEKTMPSREAPTSKGGSDPPPSRTPSMIPLDAEALAGLNARLIAKLEVIKTNTNSIDTKITELKDSLQVRDKHLEDFFAELNGITLKLKEVVDRLSKLENTSK